VYVEAVAALGVPAMGSLNDSGTPLFGPNDDAPLQFVLSSLGQSFTPAFVASLLIIVVSELGDKTFFIAALMAMKHSPLVVFVGAIAALSLMTVLSTAVGYSLPNLVNPIFTRYASIVLFLFFGVRMLIDASRMDGREGNDELAEVEAELNKKSDHEPPAAKGKGSLSASEVRVDVMVIVKRSLNRVMFQAFTMTFLAEWGDRSQIATIALAAAKNPVGVTLGALLGHGVCTSLAVLGGKFLASSISERAVTYSGGALFVIFGVIGLFQ